MRPVVSVVGPAGSAIARQLVAGQRLRFGACRCGACDLDLVVPAGAAGPPLGQVSANSDHWRLDNLGTAPLTVVDLEQPQSQITVVSGRVAAVVPFELAQIHDGELTLATVFGPEPVVQARVAAPCPAVQAAQVADRLDPEATYFAVLVALCEQRLHPAYGLSLVGDHAPLPTSPEIARALARRGVSITPRAVDAHIEYLIDKLRIQSSAPAGRAKRGWRKEALAAAALRRRLVRLDHLPAGLDQRPRVPQLPEPAASGKSRT